MFYGHLPIRPAAILTVPKNKICLYLILIELILSLTDIPATFSPDVLIHGAKAGNLSDKCQNIGPIAGRNPSCELTGSAYFPEYYDPRLQKYI